MKLKVLAVLSVSFFIFTGLGSALENEPVSVEYYWNGESGVDLGYPVYDRPAGILQDGGSLNERVESGNMGQNYLESVYLATGSHHRGIVALNPTDGSLHPDQPSDIIPDNFGNITVSPTIYSINGNSGHNATLFLVSEKGGIMAVNARVRWPNSLGSDAAQTVYRIEYSPMWESDLNGSIRVSPSIFWGKDGNNSDDMVIFVTDTGELAACSLDGSWKWSATLNGSSFFSPIADEHDNLIIVGNKNGDIWGINASTGSSLWYRHIDNVNGIHISSRYRYTGQGAPLVAATDNGKIMEIDPKNGKRIREKTLWEGCPVSTVFITHDGGRIYAGISMVMNGTAIGKGRIYSIASENMEVKWSQNTTGNITRAPLYVDSLGYASAVTDAGYFYEFDNAGSIVAKLRLSAGGHFYSPMFAPYIPTHFQGGFITASRSGMALAFSKNIQYYGYSAEALITPPYMEKALWNRGDSWGYRWMVDFGKDSMRTPYVFQNYFINYTMTGGKGGYSKMMFIKYIGKDDYGYHFDFMGGAYAKGNFLLTSEANYYYGGVKNTMRIEHRVEIYQYDFAFNGSFWLNPGNYTDSEGERLYLGVSREKIDMKYLSKTRMEIGYLYGNYPVDQSYVNNESLLLRNFTLEYQPSVPFIPLKGPAFHNGFYSVVDYSGYLVEDSTMLDERGLNYNKSRNEMVSDHVSLHLPLDTSANDAYLLPYIPLLPEFISQIASGNRYYYYAFSPFSVLGHYENGFYMNLSEPFVISAHLSVSSLYINSSSTTEEKVDNYLKNKAAYTPGISEKKAGESSIWLTVAVAAVVIVIAGLLSFLLLYRKRKAIVK